MMTHSAVSEETLRKVSVNSLFIRVIIYS